MTDKEMLEQVGQFFLHNQAGQLLLKRWDKRIEGLTTELVNEDDPSKKIMLQSALRVFKRIIYPEITNSITLKSE